MPVEMGLWRLEGTKAIPLPMASLDKEERLEEDPDVLGLDPLLIVGRQVPTAHNKFVDLLALDAQGDLHVIELKRNRTPREVVAQALDYGSWVTGLGYEDLLNIWNAYDGGKSLEDAFAARFGETMPEELNLDHRLIIVAAELDSSTERIVDYLAGFTVPIDVVTFRYLKDGEAEYLARSWLTSPTETEARSSRKKRPWNGRDFYISFGLNEHDQRRWEDARRFGFVSAGGGAWYSRTLKALEPGHRLFVHIPDEGYVGVGEVTESVQPIGQFMVQSSRGKIPILQDPELQATNMGHDLGDSDKDEYRVRVDWIREQAREDAFWEPNLFANQNSAVRLRDTHTIKRLEEHFELTDGSAG